MITGRLRGSVGVEEALVNVAQRIQFAMCILRGLQLFYILGRQIFSCSLALFTTSNDL